MAKLTNLKVNEVSFCKLGMNQHAKVALFKSRDRDPAFALAKATFQEALQGALVSDKVNEAFWDSFDGLWQRNDAFRCALTDEIAEGGDGSKASADYVASVTALVDEAVAAARTAGASASTEDMSKAITVAATRWIEKSQPKERTMKITTKAQLMTAVAAFDIAKSTFADAQTITDAAVALDAVGDLPADGPLAKMAEDKKKKPEDTKITKALERKVAVLELPADLRKHFDGLDEAGQDAFLAKSADERAADLAKANDADPVLYTTKSGREIRKSHGQLAADMARDNDTLRGDIEKLRADGSADKIAKRVKDYPNVAEAVSTPMLKTLADAGEDSEAGKAILKTLDTMNKARGSLFKSLGSDEAPQIGGDVKKGRQDFDAEVTKVAADQKIDRASAMSKVRESRPDLFKAAYPDAAEVEAEGDAA